MGDWTPLVEAAGPFAGWTTWRNIDPFEAQAGPFYYRTEAGGGVRAAFQVEARHLNVGGFAHGGCLLTFADFALFAIAMPEIGEGMAVTVSLSTDFMGRVMEGDRVEATGEVLRRGRSLVFVRGVAEVARQPVLAFSGVIRPFPGAPLPSRDGRA